jgi:hypothetical protein
LFPHLVAWVRVEREIQHGKIFVSLSAIASNKDANNKNADNK